MRKSMRNCALLCAISMISACKTASNAADGIKSAGSAVAEKAVSLVNVDLSNVLNDLSLDLKIDKSNIPINAQIPISVAANVCGVSINILSIGAGGSSKGCTANTVSPELIQAIQQQLAAEGSVGGGAQTNTGTPTTTSQQPAQQPQVEPAPQPAPDPGTSTPQ